MTATRSGSIARYTRSPRSYERTKRAPADVATARACPIRLADAAPRLAGDAHPAQLVADDVAVAGHEPGDGDELAWDAQALQAVQEVGHRRRRRQHDRGGHADRALGDDVPRRPQPRLATAAGPSTSTERSRPTSGSSTAKARNGTSITSRRATPSSGMRATDRGGDDQPGVDAEGPELLLRRGHDGEDEQERRQQLALRGEAVERPLPVHQEVPMPAAHVRSRALAGGESRRRRIRHTTPPQTTNVAATPTRPAMTVPSASWSTPSMP